jgi:hypothetical protein
MLGIKKGSESTKKEHYNTLEAGQGQLLTVQWHNNGAILVVFVHSFQYKSAY